MRRRRSVFVVAALLASSLMLAPTELAEALADAPNCLELISRTSTLAAPCACISAHSTPGSSVPDKPSLEGLEDKWSARWEADGTYRFDRSKARAAVYSIDTPPP